jgi:predicted HicB family RNase H-like nuclease
MTTDAQKKAVKKYDSNLERISVRVTPEEKDEIVAFAKYKGESVNQLIKRLINEEMKR